MLHEFKTGKITPRELIKLAFGIYRQYFKYVALVGLWIYIPSNIVMALLADELDLSAVYATGDMDGLLKYAAVMMVLTVLVLPLEAAALTYLTRQKLENNSASLEGVLDASLGNWGKLSATALLYTVLVSVSSVLVFPAIVFSVIFYFHSNIVAANKSFGVMALKESAAIVKRRWWRTFGTLAVIGVMEIVFQGVAGYAFLWLGIALLTLLGLGGNAALQFVSLVGSVVTDMLGIVFQIIITLYFFNLYYTSTQNTGEVPL